jgi:hypothetical protein
VTGLTYDTGALIAAERGSRRMWQLHRRCLERGGVVTVPAAVLVEAWRGRAEMANLLQGAEIEALQRASATRAGLLLRDVRAEAVDATVVESALRRGDPVVTSDRKHLEQLAQAAGRKLSIIDI